MFIAAGALLFSINRHLRTGRHDRYKTERHATGRIPTQPDTAATTCRHAPPDRTFKKT